jgi:S-adenosylmethionine decarboxylase
MINRKVRGLGLHVTMTLVDCNKDKLLDRASLYNLLKTFPPSINMTLIPVEPNPTLYYCKNDERNPENVGYSGTALLWESHFSLHTWPNYDEVDLDVFSCYGFDHKKTIRLLVEFFEGAPVNVSVISRGNNSKEYKDY